MYQYGLPVSCIREPHRAQLITPLPPSTPPPPEALFLEFFLEPFALDDFQTLSLCFLALVTPYYCLCVFL
jgi:hypothetical protein